MQFILEYWAQWAFALMGGAVLAAIPKIKALWQAVLALLHDRIYTECYHFLSLGHITPDGLRNLTYLYKTYHMMGGNGTGTELFNGEEDALTWALDSATTVKYNDGEFDYSLEIVTDESGAFISLSEQNHRIFVPVENLTAEAETPAAEDTGAEEAPAAQ